MAQAVEFVDGLPAALASPDEPPTDAAVPPKADPEKQHITDTPITRKNWHKHVNWLNVVLIVGLPAYGLVASYWTPLQWKTAVWSVAYYFMTGLGITAGMSIYMIMCIDRGTG